MTDKSILRRLGELLGWEYVEEFLGPYPSPSNLVEEALAGERPPIFWSHYNPDGTLFGVAEQGEKAVPWNPIENAEQRERVLRALESAGGKVSVLDDSLIEIQRIDGLRMIRSMDSSPRGICEAVVEALSTEPIDP